jgi:hypothetical protein
VAPSPVLRNDALPEFAAELLVLNAECAKVHEIVRRAETIARSLPHRLALRALRSQELARLVLNPEAGDTAEILLASRSDEVLVAACVRLVRHQRRLRKVADDALKPFVAVRESAPFENPHLPGETGARAIWQYASRVADAARMALRVRMSRRRVRFRRLRDATAFFLAEALMNALADVQESDHAHLDAALRWECARIKTVARASASKRTDDDTDEPSLDAKAIGFLRDHPGWTNARIAEAAGCSREYLSRSAFFKRAKALLRDEGRRGSDRHWKQGGRQRPTSSAEPTNDE